jgi:hypothetical protein
MAIEIAPQVREKLESLEAAVFAMDHLASLAGVIDSSVSIDFSNLHFFVSQELSRRFSVLSAELLPGVENA